MLIISQQHDWWFSSCKGQSKVLKSWDCLQSINHGKLKGEGWKLSVSVAQLKRQRSPGSRLLLWHRSSSTLLATRTTTFSWPGGVCINNRKDEDGRQKPDKSVQETCGDSISSVAASCRGSQVLLLWQSQQCHMSRRSEVCPSHCNYAVWFRLYQTARKSPIINWRILCIGR